MVAAMSNTFALILGLFLLLLVGWDVFANDASGLTFLGRHFIGLIEHLAFWR